MKIHAFWQRVRSLIKEKRVTQAEVAKSCGLAYSTFRRWITKNTIPPLDIASALSDYFGVSLDYLTFGKEKDMSAGIEKALVSLQKTSEQLKTALQCARGSTN